VAAAGAGSPGGCEQATTSRTREETRTRSRRGSAVQVDATPMAAGYHKREPPLRAASGLGSSFWPQPRQYPAPPISISTVHPPLPYRVSALLFKVVPFKRRGQVSGGRRRGAGDGNRERLYATNDTCAMNRTARTLTIAASGARRPEPVTRRRPPAAWTPATKQQSRFDPIPNPRPRVRRECSAPVTVVVVDPSGPALLS
jgi:hypothetical protein